MIGRDTESASKTPDVVVAGDGRTRLFVVDVADPSAMEVTSSSLYDASLVTARQHGSVVRLVVTSGLPDLDFVEPGFWRDEESALERNQEIVRDSEIDDWLPDRRPPTAATPSRCWSAATWRCPTTRPGSAR